MTSALVLLGARRALADIQRDEKFPISQRDIRRIPRKYRRTIVHLTTRQQPGTIIVDTRRRFLYLILPEGKAMRYGIGVGRQGFAWAGAARIGRKAKWPRWTPPTEMVARDRYAAKWANGMPGGPKNPLGARALYLFDGGGDTLYRIHGTFVPQSIGKAVSSGCIRLINADIADLYERVEVGSRVIVVQSASNIIANERPIRSKRGFWESLGFD